MNGINGDTPALYCTGLGLLPWRAPDGNTLMVKCYYSADAADTIVSPTDVVITELTDYNAWTQYSNIDTGKGYIRFHRRDNHEPLTYPLYTLNALWYTDTHNCTISDYTTPTVRYMSQKATYELYHQRFGHPGERAMRILHLHVDDVPELKGNSFYKCSSCLHGKMKQRPYNTSHKTPTKPSNPTTLTYCGQSFNIDYGFMKGSGYCTKDEEGRTITSVDGYRAYCIIVDRKSRYTWIFLTKTKAPPLQILTTFLEKHGTTQTTHKTIRTDQGGELWASQEFRQMALDAGYIVEPTGAGAPFQNGMAERPNQTFGQMVRCMLHSSGLGPEYWSFALLHAVYLKNRLPHNALDTTPYQAYTGLRPSAKYLKVFGCPVVIKNPGRRPTKLDMNTSAGRFLGYTATDRNVYYLDTTTRRLKIATHCVFDEAGMTLPPAEHTPAIKALQQAGWTGDHTPHPQEEIPAASPHDTPEQHTSDKDIPPDNQANHQVQRQPEQQTVHPETHPTEYPPEHRAKNPTTEQVPTQSQSQDTPVDTPDMPFNIYLSQDPFDKLLPIDITVKGDHPTLGLKVEMCNYRHRLRLADMVISTPASRVPRWRSTLRNAYILTIQDQPIYNTGHIEEAVATARRQGLMKLQVVFSTDQSYGIHPMEGIPQLYFDQLNVIAQHLQQQPTIKLTNAIPNANTIPPTTQEQSQNPDPDRGKFFKLKDLKQRPDWPQWRQSRFAMLDQYHNQGMFSQPQPLPAGANALHMLWTYFLKLCGTRKSRMVCNGNPRQKGTVTIGHTYANALDAASERLFWSIVADEGLIAIGADVTNAFAEAPPPKAPLYLYIDEAFREWWTEHLGNPPIPAECNVVRVHNAIQGHPESPRLWEKHIDKILQRLGLRPTTHEPCLYSGLIQAERVLFLRQVDDFAIAAATQQLALHVIQQVNQHMRIEVKQLGIIERFNGVDVHQTRYFIKLTCEKYLFNMLKHHDWLETIPHQNPIPLPSEPKYITKLEQAATPTTVAEKDCLRQQMGFNYRQVIGEIIYPMMKCRPDIAFHATKLSQYMENPAKEHYEALRQLCTYLSHTIHHGIYYWRQKPREDLPEHPLPTLHHDNYIMQVNPTDHSCLTGYADADWATDTKHRKSVTGIVLMYAGGTVGYKTKYQDTIALSSTEAEFTAACDAAKMILFFRSLLDDLGIAQQQSTILYEDNNGALMMANAQQPTRRTRHMDIKKFALLDWVERDLLTLHSIKTTDNTADTMTKALGRQRFFRHSDTLMGRRIPTRFARSTFDDCFTCSTPSQETASNMGGVRYVP